ncbi:MULTISPECIES: efflux transporter outer membrane subunit [Methylobacteriaceae]|jgi:NodT family efflux transporter outer membrane factor (OMF) lipoprotein|uniref:RND transporter n=6 Tax=Methylobacteriaceae TaxID=119045 RepID=A0A0J6UT78_9HYPH|nr:MULTISPECIES: efflux transporter outer membrane subunit [Methylobacteriaceae]MBY0139854.1 efflux transporter outer membrane subunit [Methylorubrum populi]MBZ6414633.1 efflux transporter outer membrane subunit [Methylobacterium sp.]MDV2988180.1 efflux transporter outer membrane subunit [Methylobacteriaceae bacterium AG10]KMO29371.1 RND transporter [Methylobacterium variabile]MBD8908187.1 RND transporter [Methylorubrum zatmanii]
MGALGLRLVGAMTLAGLTSACLVGPDYARPSAETPLAFKEASGSPEPGWRAARPSDAVPRGDWWSVFRDPVLDGLIRAIDVDNQTLRQAISRYEQARAVVRQARAQLFPTMIGAPSIRQSGSGNEAETTLTLQGSASWELDLFGRIRRQIESGTASAQASAAGLALVRLTSQAELATNYFQLRYQESLRRLLNDTVAGYKRSLAITQNQYAAGVAARSDVITAQTQLQTTEALSIAVELDQATFAHAIAVLSGRPPSEITIPRGQLAARPPSIPVSVPSTLLERRPDVAQAERLVQAQSEQIGVAVAAFYPSVSLSGSGGLSGDPTAALFAAENQFWSVTGAATEVLFDGGARSAAQQAARAAYEAAVAMYRQTVLTAFREVEDGLAGVRILARQQVVRQAAVASASRAVEIALNEYRAGTQNYTTVVTAQALELSNRVAALQVQASRFTTAIALIRALGGGWDTRSLPTRQEVIAARLPVDSGQPLRVDE